MKNDLYIGKGSLLDVPALLQWVIEHSRSGNFCADYQVLSHQLGLFCALFKAALGGLLRPGLHRPGSYFLVARQDGNTVGAALIHCRQSPHFGFDIELSHLVVGSQYRGQGVARAMLQRLQQQLPAQHRLWCYCAPFSRPMIKTLMHSRFRIKKVARLVKGNVMLPHRFEQISS